VTLFRRAVIVGTGLIGGSLAGALRRAGIVERVVGIDAAAAPRALALGLVDETGGWDAVSDADLVILAVPVRATVEVLVELAPFLDAKALVTDVGSTKTSVLTAVSSNLASPSRFVGGHPLAGTEKSGPEAALPSLFEGRRCVLTPTDETDPAAVESCSALWRTVGAVVQIMSPADHDRVLGLVSHLPHAVAFALAAAVGAGISGSQAGLYGGGFLDTTRIAASNPAMWRDVLLANRAAVLDALGRFEDELGQLRAAIALSDGEAIEAAVARAHSGRARVLGPT